MSSSIKRVADIIAVCVGRHWPISLNIVTCMCTSKVKVILAKGESVKLVIS